MGNQLKKEYDVNLDDQCGSGGLGLRWKLYNATDLKTKEEVTIFTFNKKDLPKTLRKDGDRYINLLKKEVERGYKFKHPNCLRVIKPIKEFRGELAFVTERIMCSLSNILGDTHISDDNQHQQQQQFTLPLNIQNYKFGELQIRSGLAQLCDAALFMHHDAHMAHGFIDAANIYITNTGDWKLFGFEFAEHIATDADEAHLEWDFTNNKELPYYPPFECLAPEIMISNIMTIKSDVFSIGRLVYILHRHQSGIRRSKRMKSADEYRRFINNLNIASSHLNIKNNRGIPFEGIPKIFIETLKNTLKPDEKLRCKVQDIINCKYLNDMIVRVIRYLEKLLEKETDGKIKFLKKLPEVISMFDKTTLIHKVIPPLMIQLADERMVNYVLPSLMSITSILESVEYQELIEPVLQRYFISIDLPQVFYILIDNVILLCCKSSVESRRDQLIPMILKGLSIRNVAIQTNVLKNIPIMVEKQYIEWKDLKNKILIKLKEISNLSVPQNHKITPLRVNVLMCLAKIFNKFDSDTIREVILNECVWKILSKTKEPAILMSVLGVCDAIGKYVAPQIISNDLLPHLIPLLMEQSLNIKQYMTFIKCIRYMIDKVDRYRINQLNRKDIQNENTSKSLTGDNNKKNISSMNDILEQEFDPNKKGEKHKKIDDPFHDQQQQPVLTTNFAKSTNTINEQYISTPMSLEINNNNNNDDDDDDDDDDDINDDEEDEDEDDIDNNNNDGFVSLSNNDNNMIGKIGDDNNTFSGFNTSPKIQEKNEKTKYNAPPVYGTKCAVITKINNKTESFGWNDDNEQEQEEENLFMNKSNNNNNNININKNIPSSSSFTVTPFGGNNNNDNNNNININNKPQMFEGFGTSQLNINDNINNNNNNNNKQQSYNDNKPKRRIRKKGNIKKNTSSGTSPNTATTTAPSGYIGFGTPTTTETNIGSSPFGFINNDNKNNKNNKNNNNYDYTTTNIPNPSNPSIIKTKKEMSMFSGSKMNNDDMFGGMQTNFAKNEDPFAGLGHHHNIKKKNIQKKEEKNTKGFDFINNNNNNDNNNESSFDFINNNKQNNINNNNKQNDDPFAGLF